MILFLPIILLPWVSGANAHGPVRQKLIENIQINASPEAVWSMIENFGSVDWLPMVESVESSGGNAKGATRVLTLSEGKTVSEQLKKYDENKMSYTYKIVDMTVVNTILHSGVDEPIKVLPVTDYASTITVKAKGNGSEVIWKAAYYRGYMNNNPPAELNEEAAHNAVQAVFRAGLERLKMMAESNQPVKRASKATNTTDNTKPKSIKSSSAVKQQSKTAFDSNYPAASFEPSIIYFDENATKNSASVSKAEKSGFDLKYPAANFEPKVIYP